MPAHDVSADWTAERAIALPEDGNRYEVLDGELFVTPAPTWRHQIAAGRLFLALGDYVPKHDSDARLVERWLPGDQRPEIVTGVLEWAPRARVEPLRVDLPALFAEVHGEA